MIKKFLQRFWIRRSPEWLDVYFDPGSKLRIQSTKSYWLWISWGYLAERQFTINRFWIWKFPFCCSPKEYKVRGFQFWWLAYRHFI